MNSATIATDDRDLRRVTVGLFRSRGKGEILLVYLNDGEADAAVMRYDQLSRNDRSLVHATAQDPLSLLQRMKGRRKAFRSPSSSVACRAA